MLRALDRAATLAHYQSLASAPATEGLPALVWAQGLMGFIEAKTKTGQELIDLLVADDERYLRYKDSKPAPVYLSDGSRWE